MARYSLYAQPNWQIKEKNIFKNVFPINTTVRREKQNRHNDDTSEHIDINRHKTTAGDDYERQADVQKHVTRLERVL